MRVGRLCVGRFALEAFLSHKSRRCPCLGVRSTDMWGHFPVKVIASRYVESGPHPLPGAAQVESSAQGQCADIGV